ncbi:hypothetical protein COCMIDRAFT_104537 [Bipolaris oryzae ATCC 44560]|uniref:Uncharacterized protein n=1 Tax=Bipolaris oryzae ATCC 44560 TaxID=930090 RepID=W6YWV6_COCMI|nr:uncharacterized protein COCMIDRAFT_104537 [Bipolaris oryzae ATCC 44560]EUC42035.1 hypothetical protein COCMIDRAFT_104537 [Bipolaris oryzae ATCC 44560]
MVSTRCGSAGVIGIFVAPRIFTPTDRLHTTKSPMASNITARLALSDSELIGPAACR